MKLGFIPMDRREASCWLLACSLRIKAELVRPNNDRAWLEECHRCGSLYVRDEGAPVLSSRAATEEDLLLPEVTKCV
jgi:hypothetical protein